jgi:hypothetical protein
MANPDNDVELTLDALLRHLGGRVTFVAGDPKRSHTTTYEFEDYSNTCIFAELMRGRGNFHGEPWLMPTSHKIRVVVDHVVKTEPENECDGEPVRLVSSAEGLD